MQKLISGLAAVLFSISAIAETQVSVSLAQDHTSFVDGLIAKETQPDTPPSQAVDVVNEQDPALLGASDQMTQKFEPSLHYVGYSRMGEDGKRAEIYYRGTTAYYSAKQTLPDGSKLVSISHSTIELKKGSGDDAKDSKSRILLPLTSVEAAQQERERFKDDTNFYKSLGL
ncbi:MAG: hypothetical protein CL693_04100 [Cellvibrionaceae bacterium]|nr:hypothetical protein [Cellvibrionaceae bacterium]